jgi:hypothetical protein
LGLDKEAPSPDPKEGPSLILERDLLFENEKGYPAVG